MDSVYLVDKYCSIFCFQFALWISSQYVLGSSLSLWFIKQVQLSLPFLKRSSHQFYLCLPGVKLLGTGDVCKIMVKVLPIASKIFKSLPRSYQKYFLYVESLGDCTFFFFWPALFAVLVSFDVSILHQAFWKFSLYQLIPIF